MPLPDFGNPTNRTPVSEQAIVESTENTLNNKTAISPSRLSSISHSLLGYADGTPVIVDYYSKHTPFANLMSGATSFSLEKGAASTSYTLIHDFEMRMVDELDIEQDENTDEMDASGNAILYPGFNPHYGDQFLFQLGEGVIGLFIVNDIKRLTISQSSHHQIFFHLVGLTSEAILAKLKASVVKESYFNKGKYLSDEITLLSSENYINLNTLSSFRDKILKTYMNEFYKQDKSTIYLPKNYILLSNVQDGSIPVFVYDPYMVEFLNYKTSISERRPIQQKASDIISINMEQGLLKAILDKSINSIDKIWYNPALYVYSVWSAGLSSIANNPCVFLLRNITELPSYLKVTYVKDSVDNFLESYIFSRKFYIALIREYHFDVSIVDAAILQEELTQEELDLLHSNVINEDITISNAYLLNEYGLSQFELFVFNYLGKGVLQSIEGFMNAYIKPELFVLMSKEERFYYLPLILHFIDIYMDNLK